MMAAAERESEGGRATQGNVTASQLVPVIPLLGRRTTSFQPILQMPAPLTPPMTATEKEKIALTTARGGGHGSTVSFEAM